MAQNGRVTNLRPLIANDLQEEGEGEEEAREEG
jgi:hypothetical protein